MSSRMFDHQDLPLQSPRAPTVNITTPNQDPLTQRIEAWLHLFCDKDQKENDAVRVACMYFPIRSPPVRFSWTNIDEDNIAFLVRHECGGDVNPHHVSAVFYDKPCGEDRFTRYHLAVVVSTEPVRPNVIVWIRTKYRQAVFDKISRRVKILVVRAFDKIPSDEEGAPEDAGAAKSREAPAPHWSQVDLKSE
jgi:hypothetical protein